MSEREAERRTKIAAAVEAARQRNRQGFVAETSDDEDVGPASDETERTEPEGFMPHSTQVAFEEDGVRLTRHGDNGKKEEIFLLPPEAAFFAGLIGGFVHDMPPLAELLRNAFEQYLLAQEKLAHESDSNEESEEEQ